mgnify:CR=1 FL=1
MIYVFRGGIIEAAEQTLIADCRYGKWRLSGNKLEWLVDGPPPPIDWRVPQPLGVGFHILVEYLLSACGYRWRGGGRISVALVGPPGSGKTTYFRRLLGRPHDGSATAGVESAKMYVEGRPVELYDLPGHRELFILPERPDGVLVFTPLDELLLEEVAWYLLAAGPRAAVIVGTKADVGQITFLQDYAEYFRSAGINIITGYPVVTPNEPRWKLAEILATLADAL